MQEQRKANRFELRLPVRLIRIGSQPVSRVAETKNLSSLGVLLRSEAPMTVGEVIEYIITLPSNTSSSAVSLRCLGKVVRQQAADSEGPAVAATLERYEFLRSAG